MRRFGYPKYGLHAAVLGGLIYAGVRFIDGDRFLKSLHRFEWSYLPLVLGLTVAYVLVKGERFVYMMRRVTDAPGSVLRCAYVAGQACSLLPAGTAARAGILEQAGIPAGETAAPLAISSLSDQALFLICAMIASLWVESLRRPVLLFLGFLIVVSVLLGLEATRTWLLSIVTRLMGKLRILDHWRDFLCSLRRVATWGVVLGGFWNTAASFGVLLAALYLCIRGVGADVHPTTLLLAFTLPAMMGRISAMPAGVGVTEAGMMSILSHAEAMTVDSAAAAVAVFRLATVLFAALFGAAVYLLFWRGRGLAQAARDEPPGPVEHEAAA